MYSTGFVVNKVKGRPKRCIHFIIAIISMKINPVFCFSGEMEQATRYSVQERIKIVEVYFATKSGVQTQRQFWRDFPGRNAPTRLTTKRLLDKFRETGSVQDNIVGRSGRPLSVRTENNIVTVRQRLEQSPRKSTRRLSQETDLSRSSVMRIMRQDLHLFPYKI